MGMYRKTWPCCGDVTETDTWEPEVCPFCTSAQPAAQPVQRLSDERISEIWELHTVPAFGKTGINPVVFARAIEAALQPQGWVLVPIEATREMCIAAVKINNGDAVYKNVAAAALEIEEQIYAEVYEAMIAARPDAS